MAGVRFYANPGAIALTAATAKTCLQFLAGVGTVYLERLEVSFDGAVATNVPVLVEAVKPTTAGTMSALTLVAFDSSVSTSAATTATHTATVEPTITSLFFSAYIHPQGGRWAPLAYPIPIPAATRWGIRVTAPDAVNVRICATINE